jgi:hypothetical protein
MKRTLGLLGGVSAANAVKGIRIPQRKEARAERNSGEGFMGRQIE